MAKSDNPNPLTSSRKSRREERFARQQEQQLRTLRLVGAAIVSVILLIVIIGLVVEYLFVPRQAVATVNGTEITMADWQDQVRFQRGQLITSITENFELFHDAEAEDQEDARQNTLRTIQQFFGQQISTLAFGHEQIGQQVLENMISLELVKQEAERRGISISQAEIDAEIGEQYSYYDGGLPTPFPTPENTVEPTPSITPIVDPALEILTPEATPTEAAVVEEATEAPTNTPQPTNTPVSQASFDEQLQEDLKALEELGVNSQLQLDQAEQSLTFRALGKALYEDNGGGLTAPHISAFLLVFATQEEAEEAVAEIESKGYLQVWNEVRSLPADPENTRPAQALERIEQTANEYSRNYESLAEQIVELNPGDISDIIEDVDVQSSLPVFIIAQVTSNQELELGEFELQQLESEALQEWLTDARATQNVEVFENWRNRVPRQPVLDSEYSQPVPTPTQPAVETGQ